MALPPPSERGISPNPDVLTIKELTPKHVEEIATRTGGKFSFYIDGDYHGQAKVTYPDGTIVFGTHRVDGKMRANGWSANLTHRDLEANIVLRETALVLGPDDSVRFVGIPDIRTHEVQVITVTGGEPFYERALLPYDSLDSAALQAANRVQEPRILGNRAA